MNRRLYLLFLAVLLPYLIFAATITVKTDGSGDFTIIQEALDAAYPGDTVLVYPGRYFESLTMQTNNVTLMSLEATTGNPAYIDSTIIDATYTPGGIYVSQYCVGVSIRGFSITNGTGSGASFGSASVSSFTNSKIFGKTAIAGGGVCVGGAAVYLSGIDIFNNYALHLGGGLYAGPPSGHTTAITFDPENRCSIYNNRAGAGQDIYIQQATSDLDIPLDTFSVAEPTDYYAIYLSVTPISANYSLNFDIQNVHHQELESDLYVSTDGDDENDGLSPETAMKTIHEAIYRIAADSLNMRTVHILPGEYSRTDNDQIFPIALKSWVKVQGSGIDTTTVIGEPHPLFYESYAINCFWANIEPAVWLSNLSITARNINLYSIAIHGAVRRGSVNFSNLRIYGINAHETYDNTYHVIILTVTGTRESTWDNVIVEDITPSKVRLIYIAAGISEDGVISALKGKFTNCTFRNATSTYTSGSVPAMPLISISGDKKLEFENCKFLNLSMLDDDSKAVSISAVQFPQHQNRFSFTNCLVSNNSSPGGVMLVVSSNNPKLDFYNCTFAGNQGDENTLMVNGEVNIVNSIFDNDTPYQIKVNPMDYAMTEHTTLNIDYSLIKDGINGIQPFPVPGNTINLLPSSFSGDPVFAGGFNIHDPLYYSLSAGSPCIDAGTLNLAELALPPYDLAGNWRVWNRRIDIGCFEFGSVPWVSNDDLVLPFKPDSHISAYPNPFSTVTNIKVMPMSNGRGYLNNACISIHNLRGQLVKNIPLDPSKTDVQFLQWDGRNAEGTMCANGIYFLGLQVNGSVSAGRKIMILR